MCSSSGISRLRLLDGRASKSRLRGQFDKAFMPLDRARFGVVHQEARRWGSGRRPSPQTAAGLAHPAAPVSMMRLASTSRVDATWSSAARKCDRVRIKGYIYEKRIYRHSGPLLASGSATGTPKPPPVLTVRWLECVVGNVDYYSIETSHFTCMFWEGEK